MSDCAVLGRMGWRAPGFRAVALAVMCAAALFGAPQDAGARSKARVTVAAPARAAVGSALIVTGRVTRLGRGTAITLEEAKGRRWVRRAVTKVTRKDGGFRLKWKRKGKKTGRVSLRISARRAGKTVRSRRVRIGFSSDPALKTTAPVLTPRSKSVRAAPAAGASGKVRLSEPIEAARGDVLALGIGPRTPYGMLAKITKVKHRANGATDLSTEPVALIDVVPSGSINAKLSRGSASSASRGRAASASEFSCTNGRSIKMTASAEVSQSVDFEIDWSLFRRINSAKLTANVGVSGSLALAADGAVSCALESREIFQKRFKPMTFAVGVVPVVLSPKASVSVSGSGSAEGNLAAGISGSLSTSAGFEYKHKGFSPIGELTPAFTSQAPAVSFKGNLAGTFTPSLEVLFYGAAGPELAFKAGAELSAAGPGCYTVSAPYSLVARIDIPTLQLESPDLTIWSTTRTLAQAPTPPATCGQNPPPPPAPPPPPPLPTYDFPAEAISAGGTVTCLIDSGAAKCFGRGEDGQLGNGSTALTSTPVGVTGLSSGVTAVAAGGYHACAIVSGAAKCWGRGVEGQLGNGSTTNSSTPVNVTGLSSGVTAIASNGSEALTCAIVSGAAKCWGKNYAGQLGDGSTTDSSTPVDVIGLSSGVTAISVGSNYACAIVSGAAKCWGTGGLGQLGNGSTEGSSTPVDVTILPPGVTAITAGVAHHTCAIVSGAVKCWGYGLDGQLGDGNSAISLTAVDVTGLSSGVTAVSAGYLDTCAIVSGAAKCWGRDNYGSHGGGGSSLTPVDFPGAQTGVTDISAGVRTCLIASGIGRCSGPVFGYQ